MLVIKYCVISNSSPNSLMWSLMYGKLCRGRHKQPQNQLSDIDTICKIDLNKHNYGHNLCSLAQLN